MFKMASPDAVIAFIQVGTISMTEQLVREPLEVMALGKGYLSVGAGELKNRINKELESLE
jgi:hypothetical protein